MFAGAMNGLAVQQIDDRQIRKTSAASCAAAYQASGSLLITRVPPVIEPRSEPTNFGKTTGHGSVNQPLESLVLRSFRLVRKYSRESLRRVSAA